MSVLVVRRADSFSMVYSFGPVLLPVVGWLGICRGQGLIFLPTTVHTDPALGAVAAAAAKDVGGVLLIVIGCEALRPGCRGLASGFNLRYSACRAVSQNWEVT